MRMNCKRLALLGGHVARGVAQIVDLTTARLDLVALLLHGALCQRELATKLCVSEGVVSRLVHALMKLGYVTRVIPAADRRFRVVSLTKFARAEYARLLNGDWLTTTGRYDVQGLGEARWRADWELPLEKMGLALLAGISRDDYALQEPAEPPFDGIRENHHVGTYVDPTTGKDTSVDAEWPWLVYYPKPPMHEGAFRDPASEACVRAWTPPKRVAQWWTTPHGPGMPAL